MDERMTASLAVTALCNAIRMRNPKGTIVHWRSWFPISFHHVRAHSESSWPKRIYGTSWACGDNAAMESFFALLQKDVLNRQTWDTHEDLRLAIITWIEGNYHRKRRQRRLGCLTPIEFETLQQRAKVA
jgi:transposase InsO family protein